MLIVPKESKEFLHGVALLALYIAKNAKDGIDYSDATELVAKLMGDASFRDALVAAYQGAGKIPAEMSDMFKALKLEDILLWIAENTKA